MVGHGRCLRCGMKGTLWHRCYECDALAVLRRDLTSQRLRDCARRAWEWSEEAGERFARGILPSPAP
eukprot:4741205-Pyramimonas_sp.AAC.1